MSMSVIEEVAKEFSRLNIKIRELETEVANGRRAMRQRDRLLEAVKKSQKVFTDFLPPDSKLSNDDAIQSLLGILDDKQFVQLVEECSIDWNGIPGEEKLASERVKEMTARLTDLAHAVKVVRGLSLNTSFSNPIITEAVHTLHSQRTEIERLKSSAKLHEDAQALINHLRSVLKED